MFAMCISHSMRICRTDWQFRWAQLSDNCTIMNHFILSITYCTFTSSLYLMTIEWMVPRHQQLYCDAMPKRSPFAHNDLYANPDLAMGRNKNVINCSIYLVWWAPAISRFNWVRGLQLHIFLHHAYDISENGKPAECRTLDKGREIRSLSAEKCLLNSLWKLTLTCLFLARLNLPRLCCTTIFSLSVPLTLDCSPLKTY